MRINVGTPPRRHIPGTVVSGSHSVPWVRDHEPARSSTATLAVTALGHAMDRRIGQAAVTPTAEQEDAAECRAQPNCRGIEVGATVVSELCVPTARSTAFAIAHNARTKKNAAPRTRTTRIEIPLLTRRSRPNPRLSAKRRRSSPRLARSFIAAPLDTSRVTIRPAAAATGCLTGYPTRGTRHG